MHIPDGYLGPPTYLTTYGLMAPMWLWASRRVKETLRYRQVPLLALGAAFSFMVMMFNVPVPGGTSGHAVGSVLVAILLGPWAAVVAVSVTLAVQAFLFGDGGVTALGANCATMAVVMPFAGWWTYRLVAGKSPATSRRRSMAAALGGYVGLNAAALVTAILFGIQPALSHDAAGRPLYCPFSLDVALPAMMLGHVLLFGLVEALATGLVFNYLSRAEPLLIAAPASPAPAGAQGAGWRKLAVVVCTLLVLAPLALYLATKAGAGEAWGEWSGERLTSLAGYLPEGFHRLEAFWHAPLPDYAPEASGEAPSAARSAWYLASGLLGVALVATLILAVRRWLARREADGPPA